MRNLKDLILVNTLYEFHTEVKKSRYFKTKPSKSRLMIAK